MSSVSIKMLGKDSKVAKIGYPRTYIVIVQHSLIKTTFASTLHGKMV